MSLTLGEKLRQAREARGTSISDVAEQTRISAHYLACIENDDFRTLPGGIFNKGFVKSFARAVGVDEQEALQDYAQLIANQGSTVDDDPKTYRPEVLTDERHSVSNVPTIIFAVVILALMTVGILFLVNFLQQTPTQTAANSNANANVTNTASNITLANTNVATQTSAPPLNDLKIEFKALSAPVFLSSVTDGKKLNGLVTPDKSRVLEPKENVKLSYAKAQSQNVQMTINGKTITLPSAADFPGRNVIEFEINKDKLQSIWESGQITRTAAPAAPPR
jgi:cytoskeleton protein RodZ